MPYTNARQTIKSTAAFRSALAACVAAALAAIPRNALGAALAAVEAESQALPSRVQADATAFPSEAGQAVELRAGAGEVAISPPRSLPESRIWALARVRQKEPGAPSRIRARLEGEGREAFVEDTRYQWLRIAGKSNGRSAPKLLVEALDGSAVFLDRIEFHMAERPASLPAPLPAPSGREIAMLASSSENAMRCAAELRERLTAMGAAASEPAPADSAPLAEAGKAYLLCIDHWADFAAMRLAPYWIKAPYAVQLDWVRKSPAGPDGWAALAVRAGTNGAAPQDEAFAEALEWIASKRFAAPPMALDLEKRAALDSSDAAGQSAADGLWGALSSPDPSQARRAADRLQAWMDSPDTFDPLPAAPPGALCAGLANWLYNGEAMNPTPGERLVYGELLARAAEAIDAQLRQDAPDVFAPGAKAPVLLEPRHLDAAAALFFASRALAFEAGDPRPDAWRKTASGVAGAAAGRVWSESMRGRLDAMNTLAALAIESGGDPAEAQRSLSAGVAALALGPDGLCPLGEERPFFSEGELRAAPAAARARAAVRTAEARRLPLPFPAEAFGGDFTPDCFDKIVLRDALGGFAVLDGLGGGPQGRNDAGAILRYGDDEALWLGADAAAEAGGAAANSLSISLNARPVEFSPAAQARALLAGARSSLAVAAMAGRTKERWTRAAFMLSEPQGLIVLDRVSTGESGALDVSSRWLALGQPQSAGASGYSAIQENGGVAAAFFQSAEVRSGAAGEATLQAWNGFPGAARGLAEWSARWSSAIAIGESLYFRAVFAPVRAGSPAAIRAAGLAAPGIRLAGGEMALLDSISEETFAYRGEAALFSKDEVLLAGAERLEAGLPRRIVCDADAAVDWVFDLESGIIRTTARSAARARIALAEEATSDPPFERDGEGLAFVRLPAGFHTLQINPPSALKAALAPALEAARGLPEGTPGAAQESGPPRSAQQGFRAVAAYDSDSPILDAWLAASDGAEAALLLCLDDGRLISLLPTGEAREAGRFEPGAARIRPLDLDLDGRPEWALGMRDGFIRALNADFEEIGAIDLNAGKNDHAAIRELEAMDFEGDGLPDLAILLGAQRLVLVDSLGRIVGERIFPEPIQVFAPGDLESDGRPEIALGGAQGMRAIARLDIGGLREVVELPRAAGAVGAAAFFPLVGTGRSAVVFADFSGQISAFEGGGANDPFAQIWAVQAGQGPIRCLAAAPVSAPGLLAVGSEDGLFAVIDSSGTMSKPQLLGSPLAALAASSDAAGSATEWLALCENKRLYAARSDRPARDWIDLSPAMDTPPRRLCAQESSGAAVFVIGEKSAAVVRREFR